VAAWPARLMTQQWPASRSGRILALNSLVSSTGSGLFMAGSVLYFTTAIGLSPTQVGIGLSLAGAVGFLTTVPIGGLADRFGPRPVLVAITTWRAAGYLAYLFVGNFWQFVVVACLLYVADRAGPPINQALVGSLFPGPDRARTMGFVRASRNVGLTCGFAVAGIALASGSTMAFRLLFIGNAVSFVISGQLIRLLPRASPAHAEAPSHESEASSPIRDGRYVALTAAHAVLFLHDTALLVVLPVWITRHVAAPGWTVTVLLSVNTVLGVLLQVPATRHADDTAKAARAGVTCAVLLAFGYLGLAASSVGSSWHVAAAVVLISVVVLTAGEMLQSAVAWQASFDLAPARSQARYLAFFHLGFSAEEVAGPVLAMWMISRFDAGGWLIFAVLTMAAGLTSRLLLTRRAAREPALSEP
jgi:MFS family permease